MDFDKICTLFTMQEPFYGIILSSMERTEVPSSRCATMGVTRNGNVFKLLYNKEFTDKLDLPTTIELLKHEVCHLAFNHFTIWKERPKDQNEQLVRNIAADIEVNSYINKNNVSIPIETAGKYGWEEQAGTIEYFKRLVAMNNSQKATASQNVQKPCNGGKQAQNPPQDSQQNTSNTQGDNEAENNNTEDNGQNQPDDGSIPNPNMQGSGITDEFVNKFTSVDDHSMWPSDSETSEDVSQIIEDMVIAAAEEVEKNCGSLPKELVGRIDEIRNRKKPKPVTDWKRYVRRYLGNEFTEFIRKSRKRESRRFPDATGNRHRRNSYILVGVDTSGSISMPEYLEFFGQIKTLTPVASFDVIECDAAIQNIYTFRNHPNTAIHGGGGTSFQPVVDYFLQNRNKYDALIYFTDGYADVPKNTPKDTLWVISSNGTSNKKDFRVNGASVVKIPKKD